MNIPTVAEMVTILDRIDTIMRDGCTYVHCWGGKGRTGTVIGCWPARYGGNGLALLKELTADRFELFGEIPQTDEQRAFVRNWRAGQ
jgi:protein-tyrosine phosphatase